MSRLAFLALIVVLTTSGLLMARDVKSQDLKTIKVKIARAQKLKDVFKQLEQQSELNFYYTPEIGSIPNTKLNDKVTNMQDLLQNMAKNHRLKFTQSGTMIGVTISPKPPKPGRISGRVADDKGENLPGATIKVVETGTLAQAGADGSYLLNLQPGTYTLEFSYISFQTQRVTGVVVEEGKSTPLNISLKNDTKGLNEVVVTSGYKKASVEGLLAKQKNASEISNGISAEQIARTPDKNIGESLKRISGVSTVDNKFVLVRGIGERYNSAMLDGVVLPSTEAQNRSFSFDMIPSNIVDNVIVSKTVTPDMNANFGGGLIQVNTKDIPTENFMSISAGTSYNDQATGKDFLSHKRGKYDYFGFDDGRRDYPKNLEVIDARDYDARLPLPEAIQKKMDEQSKLFKNDNFTVYKYKAAPSQNYQFTIGRLFALDTVNKNRFGFTGSITYRNTQIINEINQQRRSDWYLGSENAGKAYGFNTTLGGILNAGLQLGNHRFTLRNTFTHMYDNLLVRNIGYDSDNGPSDFAAGLPPNRITEADDPIYTDLLQNKLSGQHQLGKATIEWNVARAGINRQEKDIVLANSGRRLVEDGYQYFYSPGSQSQPQIENNLSRHHYANSETHYSWDAAASIPFKLAGFSNTLKAGYYGNRKKAEFDWRIASLDRNNFTDPALIYLQVAEMASPENMNKNGFGYSVASYWLEGYEGKSQNDALFAMLDNRFTDQLRLVWGIRGDYYKYTEISNPKSFPDGVMSFETIDDKAWQWLPSANLTYSPTKQINIRAAASSSMVRPELLENSQFARWSPYLGAQLFNRGLFSTRINSVDLKTEWFPGLGEIISVGAFYKKFDKPAELTVSISTGRNQYYLVNSDNAKVYGLEFEMRKNLGFISDRLLKNLTVYGNLTLQKSRVVGQFTVPNPDKTPGAPVNVKVKAKQTRPMYGQSPYLINLGLQYSGEKLGFNLAYNKSGYKTYIVAFNPGIMEYERPREQLDLQVSYRFLKKRMEVKLNAGNLLNTASTFYFNQNNYEDNPDYDMSKGDKSDAFRLKPGFSDKYEEGDVVRFSQKFGRTYSTSLTYNF